MCPKRQRPSGFARMRAVPRSGLSLETRQMPHTHMNVNVCPSACMSFVVACPFGCCKSCPTQSNSNSPTMNCSFVSPGPPSLSTPTQCSFASFSPRSTVAPGPTSHDITQRGGSAAAPVVPLLPLLPAARPHPPAGKKRRSIVFMPGPRREAEEEPVGRLSFFGRRMAMVSREAGPFVCPRLLRAHCCCECPAVSWECWRSRRWKEVQGGAQRGHANRVGLQENICSMLPMSLQIDLRSSKVHGAQPAGLSL